MFWDFLIQNMFLFVKILYIYNVVNNILSYYLWDVFMGWKIIKSFAEFSLFNWPFAHFKSP